jgi:hypothetical protein
MDADFSVELGPPSEEATLEFPWDSGAAEGPKYVDLRERPERLASLAEAVRYPELGAFLKAVNRRACKVQSAKCDAWSTTELSEEEKIHGEAWKFGSYVDLVFGEEHAAVRFSFFDHEELARSLAQLLKKAPEMPAACEAIVRRGYYHEAPAAAQAAAPADERGFYPGFYFTLYVFGYGEDEVQARERWGVALRLTANALVQLSAGRPRKTQRATGN